MAKKKVPDESTESAETVPEQSKDQRPGGGILVWKEKEETDPPFVRRIKETFQRLPNG